MHLQQLLSTTHYELLPLQTNDFDRLYAIANDQLLWEQHPNPNRYQLADFTTYFEGAILSKGAYIVLDKHTKEVLGCSRYYDASADSIFIGYTFIARKHWGTALNKTIKHILLQHIFNYVNAVKFHVGVHNIRSQKSMEKLGAKKNAEVIVAYHGEPAQINIEYIIHKKDWLHQQLVSNQ
jgi:N-acetyltransferase